MTRPFTPDQLAERWDCSGETVRELVRKGALPAFRVGRMMRITQETVEAYECGTIGLDGSTGALSSCGTTTAEPGGVIVLRHVTRKPQNAKRAT